MENSAFIGSSDAWKQIEYDDYKGFLIEYRFILDKKVRFRIRDKKDKIIYRSLSKRYADDKEAFQDAKIIIDKLNISSI